MIYTFGDSYTWGWNFFIDHQLKDKRQQLTWPSIIGKKLNQPVIDFSSPATSNWRIARKIQNLNLNENDIVLIGWTAPSRFEFGLADDYDIEPCHPDINYRITDENEDDNGVRTKRMSYHLTDSTTCQYAKQFMWLAYGPFNSELWFKEMFKIMINSCENVLNKSRCKWLMFDVWCEQCDRDSFTDIPQYIFRDSHLLNASRNIPGTKTNKEYWTKEEHVHVSDMLSNKLIEIYGN